MNSDLDRELRAVEAFARLVDEAKLVRRLFSDADMAPPASLSRFLGFGDRSRRRGSPEPTPPPRPPEAEQDWIWLAQERMSPTDAALAVLRREGRPVRALEVARILMEEFGASKNRVSILNLGPRLEKQGLINRPPEGWSLIDPSKAPVLFAKFAWGPPSVFQTFSVAAFRRELILHLLDVTPGGLMTMQILEHVRAMESYQGPALTKDLVMADMEALEAERKVKRVSKSRKWVLATKHTD